jgi:serine/threonine protein kinase
MAQVFLALETGPAARRVALKQILPHLANDTAFITMFLDEARIAARLHHPNVVEIYDLGREGEALFIAMEFVHGEDLRKLEKRGAELNRPISIPIACRIVRDAARGLDYAHKRTDAAGKSLSIVHRDVSPQNILVGFDGSVKVADFGVAKAADKATITASGVIKGKHPYMSPEQALGKEDLDHRTDLFALGVVLYEAVTNVRLFRRATDLLTLQAVAECEVMPPSKVHAAIPPALDEILMTALSREREDRYPSCAELGDALDAFLATQGDSSGAAVGRAVSELFFDRLQREVPLPALLPPLKPQPDTAKTIELSPADVQLASTVQLGTGGLPAFKPLTAGSALPTVEMRVARPVDVPAAATPGSHSYGDAAAKPTEQVHPDAFLAGTTTPFGKSAPPSGTSQYGRPVVQTVTALTGPGPDSVPTLDLRPRSLSSESTLKVKDLQQPARRSRAWRWLAVVAGAAVAAPVGWFAVTKLRHVPSVEAARIGGASGPDARPASKPNARASQGDVTGCSGSVPVTAENGRLFVHGAEPDRFKPGTGYRLVGAGGDRREFYGMAMVVELKDRDARLIADEPERLPEALFACAVEENLPLKGSLFTKEGSPALGIENTTDFEWTECELLLPNNMQVRNAPVFKAGKVVWLTAPHATTRRAGAEPKLRPNTARVRCAEGDGDLPVLEWH